MKWVNHIAIAGSVTAVWRPELVPLAVLGSTAPDWLEWLCKATGRHVRHRTVTHYLSAWLFGLLFGLWVWDWHHVIAAFCAGGLSHVIADALTIQEKFGKQKGLNITFVGDGNNVAVSLMHVLPQLIPSLSLHTQFRR